MKLGLFAEFGEVAPDNRCGMVNNRCHFTANGGKLVFRKRRIQRNMKQTTASILAAYVTDHRRRKKLSIRGLATKSGLDSGALTRLEHGETKSPRPETLRALAEALEVPIADIYAAAGHVTPYDLPSLTPYLQTRYGKQLPATAIRDASEYLTRLIDEHGLQPDGPAPLEDETTAPQQE